MPTQTAAGSAVGVREKIVSFGRALNPEELGGCLGVDEQMVRKYARLGQIPCFRLGTLIRFDPAKLCDWYETL